MFKLGSKILKTYLIFNIRNSSSLSNKNFFLEVADHATKIKDSKIPKDNLKELVKDNVENQLLLNSLHNNNHIISSQESNLLNEHPELNLSKSDIEYENEVENKSTLDICALQKQIAEIDLDELKNVPTQLLNLGPVIDKNITLKNFLKLGVDLHQIQNKKGGSNILIRLDWVKDVEPRISFLKEQANFTDKDLSIMISGHPRIFRKSLIEIQQIFDYLRSREIMSENLVKIFTSQPYIFNFDKGYVEKRFSDLELLTNLEVSEMNTIIIMEPRLLTGNIIKLKSAVLTLTKSMGFTKKEMKQIILKCPLVLLRSKEDLTQNFIFMHRSLNMPYEEISTCGDALAFNPSALSERVKYLISIKRFQTDPTQPLYTPIVNIVNTTEKEFCENIAHTSLGHFRKFLKTI